MLSFGVACKQCLTIALDVSWCHPKTLLSAGEPKPAGFICALQSPVQRTRLWDLFPEVKIVEQIAYHCSL